MYIYTGLLAKLQDSSLKDRDTVVQSYVNWYDRLKNGTWFLHA